MVVTGVRVPRAAVGMPHTMPPGTEIVCVPAFGREQIALHHHIRQTVFVDEQAIFAGSDLDEHDEAVGVVKVLAFKGDQAVGAVRLYPLDTGARLWQGDRLAVLANCRTCGAGGPLVRFAVAYAGAHGGSEMIAHVQVANVRFFERLGWSVSGGLEDYVGLTHQLMRIALSPG